MTETSPASMMVHEAVGRRPGIMAVPMPGVTIKLLQDEQMRCELRVKGRMS